MEQPQQHMQRPDFGACKATVSPSGSGEFRTPSESDLLITRLVARIAELEERLYKKELEAPEIGPRMPVGSSDDLPAASAEQQQHDQGLLTPTSSVLPMAPRLRDSFLATLRESWAKLELHAAGAGAGSTATSALAAASPHACAVTMQSLDMVATPPPRTAAATSTTAGAAAASAARTRTPGSGREDAHGGGGRSASADNIEPAGHTLSPADRQVRGKGSFAFSTHLVVDYSKPTQGSPMTPRRRKRGKPDLGTANVAGGATDGGDKEVEGSDDSPRDDDDSGSLSSIGSSGMVYDTAAEEQELDRRRSRISGSSRLHLSGGNSNIGMSMPSTPQVHGGGGSAGGAISTAAPKPPLPPPLQPLAGSRSGSDGGTFVSAPSPSGQQQQQHPPTHQPPQPHSQPSQHAGRGAASRPAGWSGTVLSKLGIAWGRDRNRDRSGGGGNIDITRNASVGSLMQPSPSLQQQASGAVPSATFSDRALQEQLLAAGSDLCFGRGDAADGGGGGRYYRYVFDPADLQAEMEVTARVRRAAAEALMEANTKLAEAQEAAAALQRQVEQSKQLELELEALRAERSAAQDAKAALEEDMSAVRRQLEGMKETEASMQAELEGVRSQADIWRSSSAGEPEKLKQENTLLRSQLTIRLSELQACRTRLSEGEAERQRLVRDAEELRNKIQWLTRINLQLETAASQLNDARRSASEWQERFMRERNVRRKLHDQLQQLKGNIRVVCRVRPVQVGQQDIVSYPLEGLLGISGTPGRKYQEYEFDAVFSPSATQCEVFGEAVAPLVRSVAVEGLNVCVLAYGQPGSGRTFTMLGSQDEPGMKVRAVRELFRISMEDSTTTTALSSSSTLRGSCGGGSEDAPAGVGATPEAEAGTAATAVSRGRYSFQIAMYEIWNEAVYDLLSPATAPGSGEDGAAAESGWRQPLVVSLLGPGELPRGAERIAGLTWHPVATSEAAEALLREGDRNRYSAITGAGVAMPHPPTSRSHVVVSVRVLVAAGPVPSGSRVRSSCGIGGGIAGWECGSSFGVLHLVDLAGPERADRADAASGQLPKQEVQSVNRSLVALGDVISALQRRNPTVPFRTSKLTEVLQDALYGNSKILLLCTIAPEASSAAEAVSALDFASRAAQVELGGAVRGAPAVAGERPDRGSTSPPVLDRSLHSGGGGGSSSGGCGSSSRSGLPSPFNTHPPLPIMNGTAAKVRAAAAAAAAGSGIGGGIAGVRASQAFNTGSFRGASGGGGGRGSTSGGGGGSGSSSDGNSSSGEVGRSGAR